MNNETNDARLPLMFLSHGPPTLLLEDVPARDFIRGLGPRFRSVRAVLCISSHWETERPTVGSAERPSTIHDFYGFPDALFRIQYGAPGSPGTAKEVAEAVSAAGLEVHADPSRGLDHGAWVPLSLMYPDADVPVFQLSIQHHLDPVRHLELGAALAPLRDRGVLILASGGAVHPLGYFRPRFDGSPPERWATDFEEWLTAAIESGDRKALAAYRREAPYPERAHPRPDHLMPLMVAAGAAGPSSRGRKIHDSWMWGDLGMGAYEFD